MLISIIVPIYKVEKYIERCLESIYNQTYHNIEIILVNDCTPDNSFLIAIGIANKYSYKYKTYFVNHTENRGIGEARNSGVKHASGDYIYFVDSDDEIVLDAITSLAVVLKTNLDFDLVKGLHKQISFNGIPMNIYNRQDWGAFIDLECCKELMFGESDNYVWNVLIKKAIITDNNLSFDSILYEDVLYTYYLSKYASKMYVLDKETYIYYMNHGSTTNSGVSKEIFQSKYAVVDKMIQELSSDYYHRKYEIENIIARSFDLLSKDYCSFSNHEENFGALSKAIKQLDNYRLRIGAVYILYLPIFYLPYKLAIVYFKIFSTIQRAYNTTKKRICS